ncbi:hypothetical protein GCM10007049_11650 [Echinicola pacifica]|uniref:Uncharacterized protein n=1 Tax=Echinicola pacifica TaxID=346377 RepID=A0A918PRW2_9BACT|nr:hypothetical protein [Echinicola pacifica]GGZ20728.1 hypothetical protein GCM10007049_11650 [Echinicola pacifica]
MSAKKEVFTPELIKIIKLFGLISVSLVLILSFFDERKSNNSGMLDENSFKASSLIYFQNVRQIHYDIERQAEAKLLLYRHKDRSGSADSIFINLSLIVNRIKDKAYIYAELSPALELLDTVRLRRQSDAGTNEHFSILNGDRRSHELLVNKLMSLQDREVIEVQVVESWFPIWTSDDAKQALIKTAVDYRELVK